MQHKLVGLLGGTFNPIHYGHLRLAEALSDALAFSEVRFIPSANPPHKDNVMVSADHRAKMVELAIADNARFSVDRCELSREGASYTIDTLTTLYNSLSNDSALCLIMGSDAFVKLNTWHRWEALLDYAHIVLVDRPGLQAKLPAAVETLLRDHYTEQLDDLTASRQGCITMQAVPPQDISATAIRQQLAQKHSVRYLLPDAVLDYMTTNELYSSSSIPIKENTC